MNKTKDGEKSEIKKRWTKWINARYIEYRGLAIGRERTVTQLAREIGLTQPTMTNLMEGHLPTRAETIRKLVRFWGPKVYDILGMEKPDLIAELEQQLQNSSPKEKDKMIRQIKDLAALYGAKIKDQEK